MLQEQRTGYPSQSWGVRNVDIGDLTTKLRPQRQGGVSQVKLLKQRTESTKAGDERARHMQGRLDLKDGGRETC